jgi:hypothetical protein
LAAARRLKAAFCLILCKAALDARHFRIPFLFAFCKAFLLRRQGEGFVFYLQKTARFYCAAGAHTIKQAR